MMVSVSVCVTSATEFLWFDDSFYLQVKFTSEQFHYLLSKFH